MEAQTDKHELDNKHLNSLLTSYVEQITKANARIETMQKDMNDTATDEVSVLLAELNTATAAVVGQWSALVTVSVYGV